MTLAKFLSPKGEEFRLTIKQIEIKSQKENEDAERQQNKEEKKRF